MLFRFSLFLLPMISTVENAEPRFFHKLQEKFKPKPKLNTVPELKIENTTTRTNPGSFFVIKRTTTVTSTVTVNPTCALSATGLPECSRAKRYLKFSSPDPEFYVIVNPEPVLKIVKTVISAPSHGRHRERTTESEVMSSIYKDNEPRTLGLKWPFKKQRNTFASFQYTTSVLTVTVTNSHTQTVRPTCNFPNQIPVCEEDGGSGESPHRLGKLIEMDSYPEFWTKDMEESIFSGEEDQFILVKPQNRTTQGSLQENGKKESRPRKECEDGWKMYCDRFSNCKCFIIPNHKIHWTEAESQCSSMKSEFVSIKNNKENKYISDLLDETFVSKVFIGGRRFNDTAFHWLDGSIVKFDKWEDGEPIYDCAAISQGISGSNRWVTVKCEENGQFVCRKNAVWSKNQSDEHKSYS